MIRLIVSAALVMFAAGGVAAGESRLETAQHGAMLPVGTEIVGLRDAYTRHYSNGDGTVTARVFAVPVHRRDTDGLWLAIPGILVPDPTSRVVSSQAGLTRPHLACRWLVNFSLLSIPVGSTVSGVRSGECSLVPMAAEVEPLMVVYGHN